MINSGVIEALASPPPKNIKIGCKKYKFNKTKLRSCTSFLNTLLKIKPTMINKYIVATAINAPMIIPLKKELYHKKILTLFLAHDTFNHKENSS